MKRIERIYYYVKEKTNTSSSFLFKEIDGVTTKEIAEALNIQRTNVSKDLNQLVREGRLKKYDGRPVRYIELNDTTNYQLTEKNIRKVIWKMKSVKYRKRNIHHWQWTILIIRNYQKKNGQDMFKEMVGASDSMKTVIEQAKAAILYPPKGLNCLITSPTGSGKTYFAHAMFQYAQLHQIVSKNKELIVFNCADYANNPELLMAHLFGYAQGAFTGATKTHEGIIHEADGGILFLDEVHRLPPEGQEMIFYFMDHGTYSRLGETGKNRKADVHIIYATTENPASTLLGTFVRRIPIMIQLPQFIDRPAKEKIELLRLMIAMEATRINRRISVTREVVETLISSVTYGNIGQLKSNVQFVTAQCFLNQMNQDELVITKEELPETIKKEIVQLVDNQKSSEELSPYLESIMTITPNESLVTIRSDSYELPYNLYEIIGDKAELLRAEGMSQEYINNFITTDINIHLKSFYKEHDFTIGAGDKLYEIIDPEIIQLTKKIYAFAQKNLGYTLQSNFIYAMGLHISSFFKRIQLGEEINRPLNKNIHDLVLDYPAEFKTAQAIKKMIEENYQQQIMEIESYYLAVLLISLRKNPKVGHIGVVVAAHGNSTATSMVQVAVQLLNATNLQAIDMPLEISPKKILIKIISAVKEVNEGRGVILLVDMGSLGTFTNEIIQQTNIDVRVVDMVTTSLVIETARKTALIDTQLDELYQSLKNFYGYANNQKNHLKKITKENTFPEKQLAIIAICASGEGTAKRIKEIIETTILTKIDFSIRVFPVSVVDSQQQIKKLQRDYQILATTGIASPNSSIPFIAIEEFFSGKAVGRIIDLINQTTNKVEKLTLNVEQAKKLCIQYMDQSYLFINPNKLIEPLWQTAETIHQKFSLTIDYAFYVNLIMHLAGALERILQHSSLAVNNKQLIALNQEPIYKETKKIIEELERTLNVEWTKEEIYYVVQMIKNTL